MPDRSKTETLVSTVTAHGTWYDRSGGVSSEKSFPVNIYWFSQQQDISRATTPPGGVRHPLPFETAWYKFQDCPCYAAYENRPYGMNPESTFDNYPFSNFLSGDYSVPDLSNNDWLDLLGKVREEAMGEFNAPVALAESSETMKMISGTATRIAHAAQAMTKRRYSEALSTLWDNGKTAGKKTKRFNSAAEAELAFQYGLKPLYQDLHSAGKDLANFLYAPKLKQVRTSKSLTGENITSAGGVEVSVKYVNRSSLVVYVEKKVPQVLAALTNPFETLWEKVPYSFVVDWVIPVGGYLSAVSLSSEIIGTWVYSTKKTASFDSFRLIPDPVEGGLVRLEAKGEFTQTAGSFKREVLSFPRIPLPDVKPFENIASWQHCANALALMTSSMTEWGDSRERALRDRKR